MKDLVVQRKGRFRFGLSVTREVERADPSVSLNEWVDMLTNFSYQGVQYSQPSTPSEQIAPDFAGLARSAFKGNGVVFACMVVRGLLFSEARFQFRQLKNGRPGDLFGNADLGMLESPGPGMTTGDMLMRASFHADLGGNWFGTSRYGGVTTLQPQWVTIIAGSEHEDVSIWDPRTEVVGYSYQPGGPGSGEDPIFFLPEEIAHYAPIPDPEARFRGMSWLTPIIREVMADRAFTDHKVSFMDNGASINLAVKFPIEDVGRYAAFIEKFREQHEGAGALKTLFLGAGMDVTPVGTDFRQLDLKKVQGGGETRIAAAAGVPPVLVGLSEGLEAATYSNYGMARRRFADMTMRPLWRNMAGSLARIVVVPGGSELWFDDRDISALQEDMKDAAEILRAKASTLSTLILAGYEPDSATAAVAAGDLSRLEHSQLISVQLLPRTPPSEKPSAVNGDGGGQNLQLIPKARRDSDRALDELLALSAETRGEV